MWHMSFQNTMTVQPQGDGRKHMFSQSKLLSSSEMVKESSNDNSVMETPHRCGPTCLGPLTFHPEAVGDVVRLSQGCRHAEKTKNTFKNGLVFSSRPVKVRERVRLRVTKDVSNWHGALRLGFTNVPPSSRALPLPIMAIPDLTALPGNWAGVVHEDVCRAGSELEFWFSGGGNVYVSSSTFTGKRKITKGLDLTKPLWAVMDIYGQTLAIVLLGSEKRSKFLKFRSCPTAEWPTSHDVNNHWSDIPAFSSSEDSLSSGDLETVCVVCLDQHASVTLCCGHRCLCHRCGCRYLQEFDTCPVCRRCLN